MFNNRLYSTIYSRMTRSLQLQPAIAGKLAVSLQNIVHGYSLCLAEGKAAQEGLSILT